MEDEPGQAIREDTPGYIAQAFPKPFPYGTGDFHCLRGGMSKLLKFEEWGRFVLLWQDGRFMRHPRFRYWAQAPAGSSMGTGAAPPLLKPAEPASPTGLEPVETRSKADMPVPDPVLDDTEADYDADMAPEDNDTVHISAGDFQEAISVDTAGFLACAKGPVFDSPA